jgi:hypothetical protein
MQKTDNNKNATLTVDLKWKWRAIGKTIEDCQKHRVGDLDSK